MLAISLARVVFEAPGPNQMRTYCAVFTVHTTPPFEIPIWLRHDIDEADIISEARHQLGRLVSKMAEATSPTTP